MKFWYLILEKIMNKKKYTFFFTNNLDGWAATTLRLLFSIFNLIIIKVNK